MKFKSVEEVLDFAIKKEEEAVKFYSDLAQKSSIAQMKDVFKSFSKEEAGHKEKLLAIKKGKRLAISPGKIMDLKIADLMTDVEPGPDLSYQQALVVAMKREKGSFKLYKDLALQTEDDGVRGTLLILAQEEAKHKLWFEVEYDDYVLKEN